MYRDSFWLAMAAAAPVIALAAVVAMVDALRDFGRVFVVPYLEKHPVTAQFATDITTLIWSGAWLSLLNVLAQGAALYASLASLLYEQTRLTPFSYSAWW